MATASPSEPRIVLVHGNDEFQIDQKARELIKTRCAEAEANGALTTIRGDVDTIDQALTVIRQTLTAIQSLNMFSPQNVTWLREVTFLGGKVFKSEEVKESVEKLQETLSKGLGPEQMLLMTVSGKVDARSRFLKAVKPVAEVVEFSRTTKDWEVKEEAVSRLHAAFSEKGIEVANAPLQEVAARVGNDTRLMQNEVEKLDIYLGERRTLTLADVELMVPIHQEAQVYQLGDCVGSRNLTKAMQMLQQMETQGANEMGVMVTLHNTLREMAYLGACVHQREARVEDKGRFGNFIFLNEEAKEGFQRLVGDKTRSPFRIYQLGRQAQSFTPGQLDRMLRLSADTYDAFFRSSTAQFEQLRLLMVKLFYECMRKSA